MMFQHPLRQAHPLSVVAIFIVLVLHVFGHLSHSYCNMTLRLLKIMLQASFGDINNDKGISKHGHRIIQSFPQDIRTVHKAFDLDADLIVYACCPKCCCLYAPEDDDGVLMYPEMCRHKRASQGQECCQKLTIKRVHNGESIRIPIRPFSFRSLDSFIAGLLCRPGIEDALEKGMKFDVSLTDLWDITDASALREIIGPDEKPFFTAAKQDELRLAWCLSVDWFNPLLNKAAGKTLSTGSIVMSCLNLPPSLRYKTENLYLVGTIPGPKEPSLEEVNHFLSPLVDCFYQSWKHGTRFSRTCHYPKGRTSRSVIALTVNDLPAARKVSGNASHSAHIVCSLCDVTKDQLNNIDYSTWKRRTYITHLKAAVEWRDAPTVAAKKRLAKHTGIRWSELLRLPYWDPTSHVVIDGMHNLFLGLVQYHFRHVIGLDRVGGNQKITKVCAYLVE